MDWYWYILIIFTIIILLVLLACYICFRMTFYTKNKQYEKTDNIYLPDDEIFNEFRDLIIQDIKEVRCMPHQEFSIKSFDGLTLYGRYYECIKGAPIEIMFHGYRGDSERDLSSGVKRAFKCNRNVLIVDQRASGKSEGHIISFGINERRDCLSWLNFVIEHFGSDVKVILTGISMGAATVLLVSNEDLPKNVIGILADCGYNSAKDIIQKVIKDMKLPPKVFYPFIKLSAKLFGHFNLEESTPYEAVQNAKVPIIFIHGDNDTFVPCHMSQKLYDACTSYKKLVTIKNAKHGTSYLKDPDTYITELNNFFKNN